MGLEKVGDGGGKAPDKPHLGVVTNPDTNDILSIPRGAVMFIIEDPKNKDLIFPLVLISVSIKKLVFGCACKKPGCNVRYEFRASRSGNHVNTRR